MVPMALYKHVANKEELLDGMVDVIVGEIDPPLPAADWKAAVRQRILSARQALLRHPWASQVIESRTNAPPVVLDYMDSFIGMFLAGGFSVDLTHHVMHALGSRMWGFTQEVFAARRHHRRRPGDAQAAMFSEMAAAVPAHRRGRHGLVPRRRIGGRPGLRRPVRVRVRPGPAPGRLRAAPPAELELHRLPARRAPRPMTDPAAEPATPSLADQVSRLYDLIAGYHVTNLIEVAREVGAWEDDHGPPGDRLGDRSRRRLGTDPGVHRCPVRGRRSRSGCSSARAMAGGWPRTWTRSWATRTPRSTWAGPRGSTSCWAARTTRTWPTGCVPVRVVPYQDHSDALIEEIGDSLSSLPRIFVDLVLPRLPSLGARLAAGARVLDLGCGAGLGDRGAREALPGEPRRRGGHRAALHRAGTGADRRAGPGGPLLGLAHRPGGPDRGGRLRRHHDVPGRPRDRPRDQGHGPGDGGARPRPGRIARALRRGVPGDRPGAAARCRPGSRRSPSGSS